MGSSSESGRVIEKGLLLVVALGALFDGWQIARLSGRVDALESTLQTVLAALVAGA